MKSSQAFLVVAVMIFAAACWLLLSGSPREVQNASVENAELTVADILPREQEEPRALPTAPSKEGGIGREVAFDPLNSATYRVRVLQEGTDRPCANFALSISAYDPLTERKFVSQSGRTDESGWWSTKIPTGPINLSQGVKFPSFEHGCRMSERIVAAKGEVIERVIHAPQLFRYGLLIQGPNGEPVANHTVQIDSTSNGHSPDKYEFAIHEKYTTDAAGKVLAAFIPGQFQATIASQRLGFAPVKFNAELRESHHNGTQVISLLSLKKVHVLVQDLELNPLPDVELLVAFQSSPLATGKWTPTRWPSPQPQVTNAEGRAVVKMAQASQGQIQARVDGFLTTLAPVVADQENVTITLGLDGGLRGRVVDENHAPIEGANVRMGAERIPMPGIIFLGPGSLERWEAATTDAEGEFEFPALSETGHTRLLIEAPGFAYYGQSWSTPPAGEFEIVLQRAEPLFGFLVNEDGDPITRAPIRIRSKQAFGREGEKGLSYYAKTDVCDTGVGGSFSFEGLAAGDYDLFAGTAFSETVVRAHTGPNPVTITLGALAEGFAVVEFELIESPVIWPLADVNVMMVTYTGPLHSRQNIGRADSKGFFRSQAVARNNGYFMFYEQGYFPAFVMLETLPDGFSKQKVYMERASSQIIHIVAADGLPLRSGTILDSPDFRAGIILDNGLVLHPGGMEVPPISRRLQKLSRYGLADYPDDILEYLAFPQSGAVLRLQEGEAGMSIDLPIPAGFEEYTVTLEMAQLRTLGLRD